MTETVTERQRGRETDRPVFLPSYSGVLHDRSCQHLAAVKLTTAMLGCVKFVE